MGGGGKSLRLRRLWHLDCQDSGKNLGKIVFLRRICHRDPSKIVSLRKTGPENLSKIFSFGKACNHLKESLFRFIKFLFGRRNFQLRKKSSGATFVESALVVALVVIAAIGGLGYLGQSIRESMEALSGKMDDPSQTEAPPKTCEQVYQAILEELMSSGLCETQAIKIATAAMDAHAAALEMGCNQDQAKKAAIWAAYTAAYDQAIVHEYAAYVDAEVVFHAAQNAYYNAYDTALQAKMDAENPELSNLKAAMETAKAAWMDSGWEGGEAYEAYLDADNAYYYASEVWKNSKILGENSAVDALRETMIREYDKEKAGEENNFWNASMEYEDAYNTALQAKMDADSELSDLKMAMETAEAVAVDDESREVYWAAQTAYRIACDVWKDRQLLGDEVAELRVKTDEAFDAHNALYDEYYKKVDEGKIDAVDWNAARTAAKAAEEAAYLAVMNQRPETQDLVYTQVFGAALEKATKTLTTLAGDSLSPEVMEAVVNRMQEMASRLHDIYMQNQGKNINEIMDAFYELNDDFGYPLKDIIEDKMHLNYSGNADYSLGVAIENSLRDAIIESGGMSEKLSRLAYRVRKGVDPNLPYWRK